MKKVLKIKEFRELRGLTQQDLAKLIKVNRVTIAEYEANRMNPTIDKVLKISIALECTPNELLGFKRKYANFTDYLESLKGE